MTSVVNRMLRLFSTAALLLLAIAAAGPAAVGLAAASLAAPPAPTGYVTDHAGVLDAGSAAAMNAALQGFDQQTGTQVVVWIDSDLPSGQSIEAFAQDAFNAWGIGQKDRNNGVLFLVFVRPHLDRITVGSGLGATLTDARASAILAQDVAPRFRAGDYVGGVSVALTAITDATRGTFAAPVFPRPAPAAYAPPASHHTSPAVVLGVIALFGAFFIFLVALARRSGDRGQGGYWGGNGAYYHRGGYFLSGIYGDGRSAWGGSSMGSSGSTGFTGGGFSGGGGSTGGGGASGSW